MLNHLCSGFLATVPTLKKNIGLFSGFVSDDDEQEKQKAKLKEKLDKCTKEKLFDFCDVLNLQIHKSQLKKEEVTVKLIDFLQSPHMDKVLSSVADTLKNFAEMPEFNTMYELYDPSTVMFFFGNKHIMIEVGIIRASVNRPRVNAVYNVIEGERESEYDDMHEENWRRVR
ncbi:DEK protein isoform X1 [Tanacetum coccineum]